MRRSRDRVPVPGSELTAPSPIRPPRPPPINANPSRHPGMPTGKDQIVFLAKNGTITFRRQSRSAPRCRSAARQISAPGSTRSNRAARRGDPPVSPVTRRRKAGEQALPLSRHAPAAKRTNATATGRNNCETITRTTQPALSLSRSLVILSCIYTTSRRKCQYEKLLKPRRLTRRHGAMDRWVRPDDFGRNEDMVVQLSGNERSRSVYAPLGGIEGGGEAVAQRGRRKPGRRAERAEALRVARFDRRPLSLADSQSSQSTPRQAPGHAAANLRKSRSPIRELPRVPGISLCRAPLAA